MSEQQKIIEYTGTLSFNVINKLLVELKEQFETLGEKIAIYKRVLVIMVEVLENINKYLESKNSNIEILSKYPVEFKLFKSDNQYFMISRNVVTLDAQNVIREKLDLVNSLDAEELKALYRQIIANGQFTDDGGAGLGFIEIAKTSQHKILYSFEKVNDTFAYFIITIEITS
jgi:hypothetical protein